ncbi:PIN domain-containing protein [Prosthecomicrobium hirschii]|uniref:type II toxin-antitoxin system VapC family toxin n=1 Tax=Prosthecodimorpha hirschii TaxID=665126 RepID=UPI00112C45A3|nr:type II toxin-antitoxin system VapC family toxin [Prosthecomicrobium hirschii]TPQ50669.1 PIN domain-containing protein [Prosthecomicrobium hirschii]
MTGPFLADTHILLWSLNDDRRLPSPYRRILLSDTQVFVSMASLWEIAIKASLGKLDPIGQLPELVSRTGFDVLPIALHHIEAIRSLPLHHRDPFDRMIIAQAKHEGWPLMTADPAFRLYDVAIV